MSERPPSLSVVPVTPSVRLADRKPSLTSAQMLSNMGGSSSRKSSLTPEGMLLAMMAAGGPSRKPSLNSTALLNTMSGGSSSRKPSLTSEGLLSAVAGLQARKPSLTSTSMLSAMAAASGRKPSLTSVSMTAAMSAATGSPSRERKPSLTSITTPTPNQPPSPAAQGRKPSNDRRPTLNSVGMAALVSAGSGMSSKNLIGSPRSPSSRHILRGSDASQSAVVKKHQQNQLLAMKATRRSFSSSTMSLEQRIELFFHVPAHRELQRLRVPRTLTLVGLQAMVQRDFAIPFEDQSIYWHGDLLEGDEDLAFYDIHDQSVLNIRVRKRYRPIGDVFTKVKTVQFTSLTKPDDFEIVEIVAPLPPTHMLFKRLVLGISYLQRLDKMQFQRTQRRVWKERVSFWEEPAPTIAAVTMAGRRRSSLLQRSSIIASPRPPGTQRLNMPERPSEQQTPSAPAVSSYVMLHSGPERVSYLVSLSQTHSIPQRLQLTADNRTPSDMRHIKKWLSGLKFFSSAALPDTAIHEIARACVYVRYNAGEFLFRQGDVGDHFYIVISGCISLAAYGNGFFATMTPGRCFGEISLIEGQSGLRTASATVNFAAPFAELAVVSGEIFRRVINPYKRAVLQQTEKAIYTVPQLQSLPDHIVTHVAYASKALEVKPGKLLVHRGEEVNVLVLLVKGEVKVSVTAKHCAETNQNVFVHPVVSVVRAPAVFCQEGALTNTPSAAPWDIEALDHCSLLCLRTDTISIFLAPRYEIIRALYREHTDRLHDFQRRFGHAAPPPRPPVTAPILVDQTPGSRKNSAAKLAEKAAYMRMLKSKLFESQRSLFGESTRRRSRRGATGHVQVQFPKILQRRAEPSEGGDGVDDQGRRMDSLEDIHGHRGDPSRRELMSTAMDSCADLQDEFLHRALPFGNILDLSDQIRFCSLAARELEDQQQKQSGQETSEHARGRMRALLRGLRRLPVEEVELTAVEEGECDGDGAPPHYRFSVLRPPTSPMPESVLSKPQAIAKRRSLKTR